MCVKAKEIQKLFQFKKGEWYIHKGHYIVLDESIISVAIINQYKKEKAIWLPTQEKLQELSGLPWWKFDERCNEIRRCFLEDPLSEIEVETKEEVGICVVMERKYFKTWTGKDWR